MTEDNRQIDPDTPGPTISLFAVMQAYNGIGAVLAHVLTSHEMDASAKGDLAVLAMRVAEFMEMSANLIEQSGALDDLDAIIDDEVAASIPTEDLWAAFNEVVGEENVKKIQEGFGK